MDITKIRSLFPITKEATYLNSASQAPLNTCVQNKLEAYLKSEITFEGKKGFNRDDIRIPLANLLGGSSEEYALTTSTGVGLGMIAQGVSLVHRRLVSSLMPRDSSLSFGFPAP